MYKIGKYDYVKLLLNQQNVSEITRAIAYYDYDNYARSKRIKKLKNTLIDIEKIQLKIDKKIAEIKKIKEEYNITDVEVDNVIDKTNLDSQIEVEDVSAEINSDENQNSKKD